MDRPRGLLAVVVVVGGMLWLPAAGEVLSVTPPPLLARRTFSVFLPLPALPVTATLLTASSASPSTGSLAVAGGMGVLSLAVPAGMVQVVVAQLVPQPQQVVLAG